MPQTQRYDSYLSGHFLVRNPSNRMLFRRFESFFRSRGLKGALTTYEMMSMDRAGLEKFPIGRLNFPPAS
jgi:hypothetical protein